MKMMKKIQVVLGLAALAATPAYATPSEYIVGDISFAGGAVLLDGDGFDAGVADGTFVQFTNPAVVTASAGDYASWATPFLKYTWFQDFSFDPYQPSELLWELSNELGQTFSSSGVTFQATTLESVIRNTGGTLPILNLSGTGIARMPEKLDTLGSWSLAVTQSGTTFSFGSSNHAEGERVPDGGLTLALLGFSVLALGFLRRNLA